MSEITTVGLDLAENVFQVRGADAAGRAVLPDYRLSPAGQALAKGPTSFPTLRLGAIGLSAKSARSGRTRGCLSGLTG